MNFKYLILILTMMLTFLKNWSVGESIKVLPTSRIVMYDNEHKVSIDIKKIDDAYIIIAEINGNLIKVPKEELSEILELNLRSVSLNYYHDGGGDTPEKPLNGLIVGVNMGGVYTHGTKKNPINVSAYLLLYFSDGKYEGWRKAEPVANFKNEWIIYDKSAGKDIEKSLPAEKVECPILPAGLIR